MEKKKRDRFVSIGWKLVFDVTIFVLLFSIVFSSYVYSSMRDAAIKRYEQQVILDTSVSGTNINRYISSMITATRSVYINHPLMDFLKYHHSQKDLEENEARITEYFKSIYYASTAATQICLVMPDENLSILYVPRLLKFSSDQIGSSVDIPELHSFQDIYIEATHVKTNYGHNIPPIEMYPADEQVITIWLPISNLPVDPRPIAYLAVDLPIAFIAENCSVINTEEEVIYVVDRENTVIASSSPEYQMKNFLDEYPWYQRADKDRRMLRHMNDLFTEMQIHSRYFEWSVIKVAPTKSIYTLTTGQMVSMLLLFGVLMAVVLVMTSVSILKYVYSIRQITTYMEKERERRSWDQERKISDYISYHKNDEIGSLMDSFQRLMDSLKEHAIQKYELKLAYTKAELQAMQAQINPHFVYNIIQCFATNALKANNLRQYQMISSFGQMLHYAMVLEPSMVSADKEIEYVKRYIELQQMRFEQQLTVIYEIEPASADFRIPKMSIQPLIENSITHGALMRKSGSVIKLKTEFQGECFHLLVKDNGTPISEERADQICRKIERLREKLLHQTVSAEEKKVTALEYSIKEDKNHNHFIGIENVFSRLLLCFGSCEFRIYANNIDGTNVEFLVPMKAKPFREVEE